MQYKPPKTAEKWGNLQPPPESDRRSHRGNSEANLWKTGVDNLWITPVKGEMAILFLSVGCGKLYKNRRQRAGKRPSLADGLSSKKPFVKTTIKSGRKLAVFYMNLDINAFQRYHIVVFLFLYCHLREHRRCARYKPLKRRR